MGLLHDVKYKCLLSKQKIDPFIIEVLHQGVLCSLSTRGENKT